MAYFLVNYQLTRQFIYSFIYFLTEDLGFNYEQFVTVTTYGKTLASKHEVGL